MAKKKEKNERIPFSYPPKSSVVKQRTKAEPVSVEGYLDFNTIRLKITAYDPDDLDDNVNHSLIWERLERYCLTENPGLFQSAIYHQFILPAMQKIKGEKISEKDQLIYDVRYASKWLYSFFTYWNKIPLKKMPDSKMLNKIKETLSRYKPLDLTELCIKNMHGEEIEKHKLKIFGDDRFNFYQTYIKDKTTPPLQKELYKSFFSGKTPEEIYTYAFRYPFKAIFKSLKII